MVFTVWCTYYYFLAWVHFTHYPACGVLTCAHAHTQMCTYCTCVEPPYLTLYKTTIFSIILIWSPQIQLPITWCWTFGIADDNENILNKVTTESQVFWFDPSIIILDMLHRTEPLWSFIYTWGILEGPLEHAVSWTFYLLQKLFTPDRSQRVPLNRWWTISTWCLTEQHLGKKSYI